MTSSFADDMQVKLQDKKLIVKPTLWLAPKTIELQLYLYRYLRLHLWTMKLARRRDDSCFQSNHSDLCTN